MGNQKHKSKQEKNGYYQLGMMILLSVITQAVVLWKSSLIASAFGAGVGIDAYNVVLSIASFIFGFIATGITTVLIPAYVSEKSNDDINSFINILYVLSVLLIGIIYVFHTPILNIFANGNDKFVQIAMQVLMITLISQLFNTCMGVTTAYFQCSDQFNLPKVSTLVSSICLVGLLVWDQDLTIRDYAAYTALTTVGNAVFQMIAARVHGMKYRFYINFKSEGLKTMLFIFAPTVLSVGLYQVNLLTDSLLSSRLGEGQVSILTYANSIINMANTLLLGNILTYIYPKLSKAISEDSVAGQKKMFEYINFMNAIICFIVVGFIVVGEDAVIFLFQRGKFTSSDSIKVYYCIVIYLISFPVNLIRDIVYRFFYSMGNTKSTFYNSVTVSIINFVISIILSQFLGLYGIILGTVISSIISLTMISIRLKHNYGFYYSGIKLVGENGKIVVMTSVTVAICLLIKSMLGLSGFSAIILIGSISLGIYIMGLKLLRSEVFSVKL